MISRRDHITNGYIKSITSRTLNTLSRIAGDKYRWKNLTTWITTGQPWPPGRRRRRRQRIVTECKNVLQIGVNIVPKMVNHSMSRSSNFGVVWTIQFCSNFTSMLSKYLSNNLWRDFRLRMLASAMVTFPLLMLTLAV